MFRIICLILAVVGVVITIVYVIVDYLANKRQKKSHDESIKIERKMLEKEIKRLEANLDRLRRWLTLPTIGSLDAEWLDERCRVDQWYRSLQSTMRTDTREHNFDLKNHAHSLKIAIRELEIWGTISKD